MAAPLTNTTPMDYVGYFVFRPKELRAYFLQHTTLEVPPNHLLFFCMDEHPSAEWSNNSLPDLKKIVRVFNEYLLPMGISCRLVSRFNETIQVDAISGGFKLSTAEHRLKVVLL